MAVLGIKLDFSISVCQGRRGARCAGRVAGDSSGLPRAEELEHDAETHRAIALAGSTAGLT